MKRNVTNRFSVSAPDKGVRRSDNNGSAWIWKDENPRRISRSHSRPSVFRNPMAPPGLRRRAHCLHTPGMKIFGTVVFFESPGFARSWKNFSLDEQVPPYIIIPCKPVIISRPYYRRPNSQNNFAAVTRALEASELLNLFTFPSCK